jgi:hypothetical protein
VRVRLIRVVDTPRLACKGFKAGKYIFAEVGDIIAAHVTMNTIHLLWPVSKEEYTGILGAASNSSRCLESLSALLASSGVESRGIDVASEDW